MGASFANRVVQNGEVLVKYTWYGDTDFNGAVDLDDHVRLDNRFNSGTGDEWFAGADHTAYKNAMLTTKQRILDVCGADPTALKSPKSKYTYREEPARRNLWDGDG